MATQSLRARTCRQCGGERPPFSTFCLSCSQERRHRQNRNKPRIQKNCAFCNRKFMAQVHTRKPYRYCSVKCGRHGDRKLIPCPRCGEQFWPWASGKHPRKFCSRGCANLAMRKPPSERKKLRHPLPARPCRWCRSECPRASLRYCSESCRRQGHNQRKHLRRRGMRRKQELIPLDDVYARDRGVCGLCHRPVSRRFKPNHPLSATLDHIVPVRLGGAHTRDNVQLAHYGCNSAKRDRPRGQLRLI